MKTLVTLTLVAILLAAAYCSYYVYTFCYLMKCEVNNTSMLWPCVTALGMISLLALFGARAMKLPSEARFLVLLLPLSLLFGVMMAHQQLIAQEYRFLIQSVESYEYPEMPQSGSAEEHPAPFDSYEMGFGISEGRAVFSLYD